MLKMGKYDLARDLSLIKEKYEEVLKTLTTKS